MPLSRSRRRPNLEFFENGNKYHPFGRTNLVKYLNGKQIEIVFKNTFKNKTVLVTGHTGFKGSWLCIWLRELGAKVVGFALEPYTNEDNFVVSGLQDLVVHNIGDIRNLDALKKVFASCKPEFVFHLAAQALVRTSYENPKETYDVNVAGTVNVLECCRQCDSVRVIINITSDKCYENREWVWGYREKWSHGGI